MLFIVSILLVLLGTIGLLISVAMAAEEFVQSRAPAIELDLDLTTAKP